MMKLKKGKCRELSNRAIPPSLHVMGYLYLQLRDDANAQVLPEMQFAGNTWKPH